jgi:hypothetical protein
MVEWNTCVDIVNEFGVITVIARDGSADTDYQDVMVSASSVQAKDRGAAGLCKTTWLIPHVDLDHFTCGRVEVSVQGGTVRGQIDQTVQPLVQTAYLDLPTACPRFRQDSTCWVIWDPFVVEQKQDAQNLVDDLGERKIPYRLKMDLNHTGLELWYQHFLPWCILIPELQREIVGPHVKYGPEVWDDYVNLGGILISVGGSRQIASYNSIFGVSMCQAFSAIKWQGLTNFLETASRLRRNWAYRGESSSQLGERWVFLMNFRCGMECIVSETWTTLKVNCSKGIARMNRASVQASLAHCIKIQPQLPITCKPFTWALKSSVLGQRVHRARGY